MDTRNDTRRLAARLERLERQNRKLRLVVTTALIAVVSAGLVGFSAIQEQLIWGRQFVLVDANETKRAELIVDEGGAPVLKFYDADGKSRAEYGLTQSGSGMVRLRDAQGTSRVSLDQLSTGGSVNLNAANGNTVGSFTTYEGERPMLYYNDAATGNLRYINYITDDGPYVAFYSPQEQMTLLMQNTGDGSPIFNMYDKSGGRRFLVGFASEWTSPVINIMNGQGVATALLGSDGVYLRDGQSQTRTSMVGGDSPGVRVIGADGTIVWQSGAAPAGGQNP